MGRSPPDITLVVVDCLRKDYAGPLWEVLEPFGFHRYERAVSASNWTIPSHASMFTGLYPSAHGARESDKLKIPEIGLDPQLDTVVDTLRGEGYGVNWFTANILVSPGFGFPTPDNLEVINNFMDLKTRDGQIMPHSEGEGRLVGAFKSAVNWAWDFVNRLWFRSGFIRKLSVAAWSTFMNIFRGLRWPLDKGARNLLRRFRLKLREAKGPQLNYVNLMEAHEPYDGVDMLQFSARPDLKRLRREYRKEVGVMAPVLRRMVRFLEGRSDNNLIVVVADHGQLLGENRDILYHMYGADDELLRVPLFIKFPKGVRAKGGRGWVTLTRLRELMERAGAGELESDSFLYSPVAFAETFNSHWDFKTDTGLLAGHRLAVYCRDSKGIYNVDNGELESVQHFGGDTVNRTELEEKARGFLEFNEPAPPHQNVTQVHI